LAPLILTLFPYTTLFRSLVAINLTDIIHNEYLQALAEIPMLMSLSLGIVTLSNAHKIKRNEEKELSYSILKILTSVLSIIFLMRSEEHTSELQSRENIVC